MLNIFFSSPSKLIYVFVILGLLNACASMSGSEEAPKEKTRLEFTISADAAVNPDESKRPSPIQVVIYELKNPASFNQADYFSLHKNDKEILATDMLARDEFILRPGEKKIIKRKSKEGTTAIGVLAGYYNLSGSTWRAVAKLPPLQEVTWYRVIIPSNKSKLDINLEQLGIIINEEN